MRLTRLLIPAFLLFSSQHAIAKANYPDRPIKMTVPLAAARPDHEVLKAVVDPDLRRKLEELGFAVRGSSAEELRAMRRDQLAKYERVITGIPKEHCRADGATDAGCLAPISSWRKGDRRGQRSTQRLLRRTLMHKPRESGYAA